MHYLRLAAKIAPSASNASTVERTCYFCTGSSVRLIYSARYPNLLRGQVRHQLYEFRDALIDKWSMLPTSRMGLQMFTEHRLTRASSTDCVKVYRSENLSNF